MDDLSRLSKKLKDHNSKGREISKLIGRKPTHTGRIGEFIAGIVFNIKLHDKSNEEGSDGVFLYGTLACKTVNIKWYTARETILSLKTGNNIPEYYLVMTGPEKPPKKKGAGHRSIDTPTVPRMEISRPLVIHKVFLFNTKDLYRELTCNRVQIKRNATSIKKDLWLKAEIYPKHTNTDIELTPDQECKLRKFW